MPLSFPPSDLRIGCLLPSATQICIELGLEDFIVGVTHECQEHLVDILKKRDVRVLTKDGLVGVHSQGDIHQAVSSALSTCNKSEIPSFYPLIGEEFVVAKPNVVFTQDLCAVCAPTTEDVKKILNGENEITIVSLEPSTLEQVADTFVTVASACGIKDRGLKLRDAWLNNLCCLQSTILQNRDVLSAPKKVFLLEWLDPPMDSGHWTYQMMDFACVEMANQETRSNVKSKQIDWEDVHRAKPDALVVGCCGFNLKRNVEDALRHSDKLAPLVKNSCLIFACDGNSYVTEPGPSLLQGTAILAQCAYHDQPQVLKAIERLGIMPLLKGFQLVDIPSQMTTNPVPNDSVASPLGITDIEDLLGISASTSGFAQAHEKACQAGKRTYEDPETGYLVFTELEHKNRGYCCGSGCRHCPYSHENVGNMVKRIQQPAILYKQSSTASMFSLKENNNVKVLFNSGGKDSFLTIRALAKSHNNGSPFGLILLTTFDSTSRKIAHQEIPIEDVVQQAKHLDISLLGVPLRRSSGESYSDRIQRGLEVIEANFLRADNQITSLVFGDLHLEHIKAWRDNNFTKFGFQLEYPLWKSDYTILLDDLEKSKVPCYISASSVQAAEVGRLFDRQLFQELERTNIDCFGENGEFHSLAKVWEVDQSIALK
jgi:diphthamide synthase (EF-2-diphthine--ammonia ligase)/ABC-type Fe3+-hydroxamate transport system substrate-binding protein